MHSYKNKHVGHLPWKPVVAQNCVQGASVTPKRCKLWPGAMQNWPLRKIFPHNGAENTGSCKGAQHPTRESEVAVPHLEGTLFGAA